MPRSPRPGSSSGSSSSCWPKRASTQAWKRVPKRAAGDGCRGIGRARSRANVSGSSRSRASDGRGQARRAAARRRPATRSRAGLVEQPLELVVPLLDRGLAGRSMSSTRVVGASGRTAARAPARRPRAGASTSAVWCGDRPRLVGRVAGVAGWRSPLAGMSRHGVGLRRPSSPAPRGRAARYGEGPSGGLAVPAQHEAETDEQVPGAGQARRSRAAAPRCASCSLAPAVSASMSAGVVARAAAGRSRGVAAQRRRAAPHGTVGPLDAACGWSGTCCSADADQEHRVPLQALGAVDGEQLDRVGLGRGRHVEALRRTRPRPRARPAAPASVTAPSTAWNSATALTNRSRLSRRAAPPG